MDKRTFGIIAVIISTLTCGLPGLVILCAGLLGVFGVYIPDSNVTFADNVEKIGTISVLVGITCFGVAGIITPVLVGVFTLRQPKPQPLTPEDLNMPIPPPG